MATVAAWVTHLENGELLWERFDNGYVKVTVLNNHVDAIIGRFHFTIDSENWEEIVKVLTLKEKKDASVQ